MSIEQRVRDLNLVLPPVPTPAANFANAVRVGNLVFVSGTRPYFEDGVYPTGRVGADVTTREANKHARQVALNILAILRQELGSLDGVRRIVKLHGMIHSIAEFEEHSKVMNGCSDVFFELFGKRHARSSIGVNSLPFGSTLVIDAIVEVA